MALSAETSHLSAPEEANKRFSTLKSGDWFQEHGIKLKMIQDHPGFAIEIMGFPCESLQSRHFSFCPIGSGGIEVVYYFLLHCSRISSAGRYSAVKAFELYWLVFFIGRSPSNWGVHIHRKTSKKWPLEDESCEYCRFMRSSLSHCEIYKPYLPISFLLARIIVSKSFFS